MRHNREGAYAPSRLVDEAGGRHPPPSTVAARTYFFFFLAAFFFAMEESPPPCCGLTTPGLLSARYFFFFLAAFFFAMEESPPFPMIDRLVAHRFAAEVLGELTPAPLVVQEIDV